MIFGKIEDACDVNLLGHVQMLRKMPLAGR
jgi:hypothetical protein